MFFVIDLEGEIVTLNFGLLQGIKLIANPFKLTSTGNE